MRVLLLLAAFAVAVYAVDKPVSSERRVYVEMFVMSRCPDAQRAEAVFDEVLKRVHSIVHVQLHYIADPFSPTVTCKHGEIECAGNKQQLCAYVKSPGPENFQSFWQFVMCQNQSPAEIGELSLAERCLERMPKAISRHVHECMTGFEGDILLRVDANVAPLRGVERSCTIYIEGQQRCVHDGGNWYDCPDGHSVDDFVTSICNAFYDKTGNWPVVCGEKGRPARMAQIGTHSL